MLLLGCWQEEKCLRSKYSLPLESFWSLLHLRLLRLTPCIVQTQLVGAGEDPVPMMCPWRVQTFRLDRVVYIKMQISYNPSTIFSFVPVDGTSDRLFFLLHENNMHCQKMPLLFNYN